MSTLVGGTSSAREADAASQAVADAVKSDVESKTGNSFDKFEVKQVATQVVAGTMYYLKVDVGSEHLHLKVFQSLPPFTYTLNDFQTGKTAEDAIGYF